MYSPCVKERCDVIVSVTKIWTWLLATLHISPTSSSWCSGCTCWSPLWSSSTSSLLWWATPTSVSRWAPAPVCHLLTAWELWWPLQQQSDVEWKFGLAKLIRSMHRTDMSPSPINLLTTWLVYIFRVCKRGRSAWLHCIPLEDWRVQWIIIKSIIFYVNTVLDISRKES